MKYALIAASIAAFVPGFGCAFAQEVNERREAPVAAPGQTVSEGQGGLRTSATPRKSKTAAPNAQAPETTARSLSREAGSDSSSEEESTAAEAPPGRDAVGRTLDRTHDLSQTASNQSAENAGRAAGGLRAPACLKFYGSPLIAVPPTANMSRNLPRSSTRPINTPFLHLFDL